MLYEVVQIGGFLMYKSVSNDSAQPGSIFSLAEKTPAMCAVSVSSPFPNLIPRQLTFHLDHAVACFGVGHGLFLACAGLAETVR